jgi:hypothetical protein
MTKTATVSTETTAIHHTGRAWKLPAGVDEVVDRDGPDEHVANADPRCSPSSNAK